MKAVATGLCMFGALGVVFIIIGSLYLAFSPIGAVLQFFFTFYLIFSGKVSPYHSFSQNWSTLTNHLTRKLETVKKIYVDRKESFKSKKSRV